jgi:RNA polymerase sigma-70 factor, ECF subfamily
MTDDPLATLLAKVARQDRPAFREVYAQMSPKLFGVLVRMLGKGQDAEDALQEVFTRIWLRAGQYDPAKGLAEAWLVTVARNLAIDRLRARPTDGTGAEADHADTLPDPAPGVETRLLRLGEARRIVDCMGRLDPAHAAAVQGAYLAGASYQSLAERFDVPLNTMRTWLRRALIALKECVDA